MENFLRRPEVVLAPVTPMPAPDGSSVPTTLRVVLLLVCIAGVLGLVFLFSSVVVQSLTGLFDMINSARGISALIIFCVVIFLWIAILYNRNRQLGKALGQQNTLLLYSQIQALQAQMNPHFIFNVLSTIHHLVKQNANDQASVHLLNLATMIRKFLDASVAANHVSIKSQPHHNEITLEHEIDLLHMYLQFEKLLHGAAFDYVIEVDAAIAPEDISIPPMILHPFVENAVKHGLLPKKDKGLLQIRFTHADNGLIIDIEDNGIGSIRHMPKPYLLKRQSYGKHLVKQRVQLLSQMGYKIEIHEHKSDATGTHVTITLET